MPLFGYAGMSPAERLRQQQMADQFSALEDRADLGPRFANNPLAELGHDAIGGLMGVDFLSRDPYGAWQFGEGYTFEDIERERATRGGRTPIFESYMEMDPVAATEVVQGQREYLVEPGGIGIGSNYFTPAVKVHEYGHGGLDALQLAIDRDPSLAERFNYRGAALPVPGELARDYEEAVVETTDNPLDTWIQPRGAGPVGTYATVEPSIQFLPDPSDARRPLIDAYGAAAQELAREVLTEQRGFGPAVMQQPGPGNMFYREPEINRGIGGLFNRVTGIFN